MTRLIGVALTLATATGCASGARLLLFSSSPSFVLEAEETRDGVDLASRGLLVADLEDDLCAPDDEACEDDLFLGVVFYRSDEGPYGEYREVATVDAPEWTDPKRVKDQTVWRAGILRQTGDDDPRLDKISIAAALAADTGG